MEHSISARLFDFTKDLLFAIKSDGKKYIFITNNSSKSVMAYVEKLRRLGIEAAADDFLTSSQATAWYLKKHYPGKRLYVCGTESLKAELRDNGFEITENTEKTECIVMGFDTELTFKKLEDVSKMSAKSAVKCGYRNRNGFDSLMPMHCLPAPAFSFLLKY